MLLVRAACCSTGARALSFNPRPSLQQVSKPRDAQVASNIGDDMMDFIQAGPKMRKWYGETDKLVMPKDRGGPVGDDGEEEEAEPSGPREAIVVVGGDSELGQLVVLQLVLARSDVRVLVKDAVKTKQEFGPYVKPVQGDVNNSESLEKVMKGAKSVVICGPVGKSARAAAALGLEHIVLPSVLASSGTSLGALFGNPEASMQDQSREADVMSGPVPYTVVRFEPLLDQIGGKCGIELSQQANSSGEGSGARITREDAAIVVARALASPPGPGEGALFVAGAVAGGVAPSVEEWEAKFAQLGKVTFASAPTTA